MGHIITFAQQKGGSGKTTLLIHLAHYWAGAGRSVAVADLDPQGTLGRWHALTEARVTLAETKDYRAGSDLKAAAKSHDLVLVDCPGSASTLLEAALRESDLVIAPCQPSPMDVWAIEAMQKLAARAKAPLRAVLNRVPPRGGAADQTAEALAEQGVEVLAGRIGNRVAFSAAIGSGGSALDRSRRSTAAQEVAALAAEIERHLA